jgi:hypothetical protein
VNVEEPTTDNPWQNPLLRHLTLVVLVKLLLLVLLWWLFFRTPDTHSPYLIDVQSHIAESSGEAAIKRD